MYIEIADQYNAQQLKKYCFYFLMNEFEAVSKTEAYKTLSPATLEQLHRLIKPVQTEAQSIFILCM
jgi:hypothetical protein